MRTLVVGTVLFFHGVNGFAAVVHEQRRDTFRLFSAGVELPEGLFKTVSKEGDGPPLKRGDIATVKYSCYLPDSPPFARSEKQRVVRYPVKSRRIYSPLTWLLLYCRRSEVAK